MPSRRIALFLFVKSEISFHEIADIAFPSFIGSSKRTMRIFSVKSLYRTRTLICFAENPCSRDLRETLSAIQSRLRLISSGADMSRENVYECPIDFGASSESITGESSMPLDALYSHAP
ncbi:MAG: hypothetical protein ACD_76C00089G0001 [uncultured bacterium]|nr:MAG: hypothetical protein ACD_76C00089G0001 [uncultured bacterium]